MMSREELSAKSFLEWHKMMKQIVKNGCCLDSNGLFYLSGTSFAEQSEGILPFQDETIISILDRVDTAIEEVHNTFYKPKGQNSRNARKGCGTSKSAYYNRLQEQLSLMEAGKTNGSTLLEFGFTVREDYKADEVLDLVEEEEDNHDDEEAEDANINVPPIVVPGSHASYKPRKVYKNSDYVAAMNELRTVATLTKNARTMEASDIDNFRFISMRSIIAYLQYLGKGVPKVFASNAVADMLWERSLFPRQTKASSSYRATVIREWGEDYMATRKLPEHRQGKHIKTATVITDENVQRLLREYLRSLPNPERNPTHFQEALSGFILDSIPSAKSTVSVETARRWMHYLGFSPARTSKDYYTDDHNRDDVVRYRNEIFLPQMMAYAERMVQYEGEDMNTEVQPENLQEPEVVFITHDESTFYANDGAPCIWMEGRKRHLKPKTNGLSIMISGFMCPCHGFMEHNGIKSYLLFEAGKNRDGWFTNDDLINQLESCFDMMESIHEGKKLLFAFDNSNSHHKRSPDALKATNLRLKDDAKGAPIMRDGWYMKDGVRVTQPMQLPGVGGRPKGLKRILSERGRWREGMNLQCHACKSKTPHESRPETYGYTADHYICTSQCCARYCLSNEPDFLEQREWIREVIEERGHYVIYYPKYHCELNFIERVWGYMKAKLRKECDYSFAGLKGRLPHVINSVTKTFVRKLFRSVLRFMQGYQNGLEGGFLEYVSKEYRSHRRIPAAIFNEEREKLEKLRADYDNKINVKIEKNSKLKSSKRN